MTKTSTHLKEKVDYLSKRHEPRPDSFFRGVTGNLLSSIMLLEALNLDLPDNRDYTETVMLLDRYLQVAEQHSDFRQGEMFETIGHFPDDFDPHHPRPHHNYVERALSRIKL